MRYSTVLKSKTEEKFKWQLFSGSFYMTLVKRENVESNILAVRSLSRSKICNNHCSRLVTGILSPYHISNCMSGFLYDDIHQLFSFSNGRYRKSVWLYINCLIIFIEDLM